MVLLINVGLRNGGGMGESMTMYTEEEHFQRWGTSFILNFAAFFIVNMVLLNVVFGIIIDTFGERRDTRTEFELDRDTQCTVCGHGIKDFQKLGKGMFKRVHVKNEVLDLGNNVDNTHIHTHLVSFLLSLVFVSFISFVFVFI